MLLLQQGKEWALATLQHFQNFRFLFHWRFSWIFSWRRWAWFEAVIFHMALDWWKIASVFFWVLCGSCRITKACVLFPSQCDPPTDTVYLSIISPQTQPFSGRSQPSKEAENAIQVYINNSWGLFPVPEGVVQVCAFVEILIDLGSNGFKMECVQPDSWKATCAAVGICIFKCNFLE